MLCFSFRDLNHWWSRASERGYRGSKLVALLRSDGSIEQIDMVATPRWSYNGDLSDVEGIVFASYPSGGWTDGHRIKGATPERVFTVARRLARWLAWRERWLDAHPEVRLEEILRHRDWYAHMSDSHAAWAAGMREDDKLRELVAKVAKRKVRTLWKRYAPKGVAAPV